MSINLANLSIDEQADPSTRLTWLADIVAIDPPSVAALRARHVAPFTALGRTLHQIVTAAAAGNLDTAAKKVNTLLTSSPAYPHLAKDGSVWRLHHHPVQSGLVEMWTAICAEALARLIGTGYAERLGICQANDCSRAFLDESKNASRRFCSTTCQNRTKAAAFRSRRVTDQGRP